ncbi:MAG: response regulator [Ignavibacteriaceae bacterium]|nr:response regulator [Ignavibacteriaceae bacterium]
MQTTHLKLFSQVNSLINSARRSEAGFIDSFCDFLVDEFQFQSAILFRITEESKLQLLGKSSGAKKSYLPTMLYDCGACKLLRGEVENYEFSTDPNCQLQSIDHILYEACQVIKSTKGSNYFLKVSQKSQFTNADKEHFRILGEFISVVLSAWSGKIESDEFSLGKLIAELASEFRTPSNSILGFTSLLSEQRLTPGQTEYVATLKDNAQKLTSLINDLVDIAKCDSQSVVINTNLIKLDEFINEIKTTVNEKLDSKVSFDVVVEKNVSNNVKVDNVKLKYILNNIIAYYVYSTSAGKISLTISSSSKEKLNFKFSNSGSFKPLVNPKNFFSQPYTGEDTKNKIINASILGVSLSRNYIELMDGRLEVNASSTRGTVIQFYVKAESLNPIEATITSLPKSDTRSKVLVIEDDYATSKLLSNYLNKWGYEPAIINSGEKALQILKKEKYLAVIMDIVLPDVNGLELLKKIRELDRTKNMPVIVCSVEAEQQKAFMMGAVEYFVKPIKYKDLVEVLTSYKLKKDSNVLCVDDDIPTLNLVKSAIESVGYNAIAESVSVKVMDLIKDMQLDLAIVDLDMPEVNGFELIKLIKSVKKFSNLPIIIYTGKEDYAEDLKKIDGLFTDLLDKRSTKIEDLADTISAMINRYEEPTPPEIAAKQEGGELKILLVEDYKHSQIIVTRLLKKNGFNSVVVVENGAEALERAKEQKFDLVLMDMQMPVMNGFEATERMRQLPEYKDTPIIALTAFAMKGDREKCIEAGATDYIPKPIDSVEFIDKVRYYTSVQV